MQEARRRIATIKALEKELNAQRVSNTSLFISLDRMSELVDHVRELEEEVSWLRREQYVSKIKYQCGEVVAEKEAQ